MFGFSAIGVKLAIVAIVFAVLTGGYIYVQKLHSDLRAAAVENARLEDSIKAKDAAMEQLKQDLENMNKIRSDLDLKLRDAEKEVIELEKRFNESANGKDRDIGLIAKEKANAVELRINRGTRDALRCNEIVTGSPLTNDEKSGKIRNSICPDLLP